MIYASLFSGIEAASVAWATLGWKPAFFAEIEKFPSRVLAHHYPDVPNYGDVTKYKEWPEHAIDLLVGGSPCQSFSRAGLRRGLADPRGNLMLTYIAVAQRYRPPWLVWENVAGVLSSDGGRAFATLLHGLEEIGYSCAWRVLDAQYVRTHRFPRAVPQQRRRVFLVGYLGDWRRGAEVLFEREGLRGEAAPRRKAKQAVAGTTPYRFVSFSEYVATATASTVCASESKDSTDLIVTPEGRVRRLTPLECERLMGFPDGYTALPQAVDSARYKALGNSMAVNCMHWIGERIAGVEKRILNKDGE